jgi:hypothetical protein
MPANCRYCGLEIDFRRLPNGKWQPINSDGFVHWTLCKETQRRQSDAQQRLLDPPRRMMPNGLTHVYDDPSVPAWDASLGEFREFTDAEKQAGVVCAPI